MASTQKRAGSTISKITSRASTTWPATTLAADMTPLIGARISSRSASVGTSSLRFWRSACELALGLVDLDRGNRERGLEVAGQLGLVQRDARLQLGDLALQVALVVGLDVVLQLREQIALLDALADKRQAALGRLDPAGMAGLDAAKAVGIGDDRARQLERCAAPASLRSGRFGPTANAAWPWARTGCRRPCAAARRSPWSQEPTAGWSRSAPGLARTPSTAARSRAKTATRRAPQLLHFRFRFCLRLGVGIDLHSSAGTRLAPPRKACADQQGQQDARHQRADADIERLLLLGKACGRQPCRGAR